MRNCCNEPALIDFVKFSIVFYVCSEPGDWSGGVALPAKAAETKDLAQ